MANLLPTQTTFDGYQGQFIPSVSAVIASSGTESGALHLKGLLLAGILLPAAFTGATITFKVSFDGTNFFVLKSTTSGTSLTYTVTQGTYAAIDPKDFYGVNYMKIVSASTESGARTLKCALRGL